MAEYNLEIQVRIYRLANGLIPYLEWLSKLKDKRTKQKIQARINQLRLGNFGKSRNLGQGVGELKIYYGPGYRIYFGREGQRIVILLCGGNKDTQDEDIQKAKQYWSNYKEEKSYADE